MTEDDMNADMQKARIEMQKTAERIGSPYIVVESHNDNGDETTPLAHIGLHFELMLNSLMLKYVHSQDDNYISFLAYISTMIENFALLTSEFGLRQSGYDPRTGDRQIPNSSNSKDYTDYQVPDIFKDGLKDTDLNLN